jgi:hypothetical protein
MIRVSVRPGLLVAGRITELAIELSNTGLDTCSDIAFRLKLPSGLVLVSGRDKISVDKIRAGQAHVHRVTVRPGGPGDVEVRTTNFAYLDADGVTQRDNDWRASLRILAGDRDAQGGTTQAPPPGTPPAQSRLTMRPGTRELPAGAWTDLNLVLRNETGLPLHDIAVTLAGPLQVDPASPEIRLQVLRAGETRETVVGVRATEHGTVPVNFSATFRYQDERGQVSTGQEEDRATVVVHPSAATLTTILYLAAQPRDTQPLDSLREMREVETELGLARNRERYLMVHRAAVRLTDISRALGEHRPQIVHFAGHGDANGNLAVEDESGLAVFIHPDGVSRLLGRHAGSVRCVIVNACHSLALAQAVAERIDYAIGMRSAVLDRASVLFSVGFYQGLFAGQTIPDAYGQGVDLLAADPQTRLHGQHEVPALFTRPGA